MKSKFINNQHTCEFGPAKKTVFREVGYFEIITPRKKEGIEGEGLYVEVSLYIDIIQKMKDYFDFPEVILSEKELVGGVVWKRFGRAYHARTAKNALYLTPLELAFLQIDKTASNQEEDDQDNDSSDQDDEEEEKWGEKKDKDNKDKKNKKDKDKGNQDSDEKAKRMLNQVRVLSKQAKEISKETKRNIMEVEALLEDAKRMNFPQIEKIQDTTAMEKVRV